MLNFARCPRYVIARISIHNPQEQPTCNRNTHLHNFMTAWSMRMMQRLCAAPFER
jgi:hypothetical protein